jgi:tRNA threonylcarbamoyladenosine biosynthesis protein TsaB
VRVALSVAKGMAGGLHLPAWGVSSLEAVALAATPSELPVRAVLEAGRGRYATVLYSSGVAIDAPRLATLEQLTALLTEPTVVIGELESSAREALATVEHARLAPRAASARRAAFLAELGWRMAERGEPGDPATLDAIYIA